MQEKKILIQMRDLRVGSGIASCIMKYYEYTVEQGYTIDFLLNRNIDSPFVDTVKNIIARFTYFRMTQENPMFQIIVTSKRY